jgi:PhnB protein
MPKNPPEGYNTITPYIISPDAEGLIDFVEKTLDGTLMNRFDRDDGSVQHAEVRVGDSVLMIGGANDEFPPFPLMAHLYVDDVDRVHAKAVTNGARSVQEPENQFYGDRTSGVTDPDGNTWWLATRVEDVDPEEMARRATAQG